MANGNRRNAAIALAAAMGFSAYAAPAMAEVDVVTVTARKTAESLQTVPVTVTAVSGQAIERFNYDKVADLLGGKLQPQQMHLGTGTLNVFRGVNTAHRVTPVQGATARMIAVFSFFDRPGVMFSEAERTGFYGRSV